MCCLTIRGWAYFFKFFSTVSNEILGTHLKKQTVNINVFKGAILRDSLLVTVRAGRQEAFSSATVSQHPAVLPLAKVIGCGAERGGGGG